VDNGSCPYKFFLLEEVSKLAGERLDIIVLAVSISSLVEVLQQCPPYIFHNTLVVDVLSVKVHAKRMMMQHLPSDCDLLCTHPMFGRSSRASLAGLPFVFECVRITDRARCDSYLDVWRDEGCKMLEMSCEAHDELSASSQFASHLVARTLQEAGFEPSPIDTANCRKLQEVMSVLCGNSFDLFQGLYTHNAAAPRQVALLRQALDRVEARLLATGTAAVSAGREDEASAAAVLTLNEGGPTEANSGCR
jgi:arogenate dehydrogenase (NADP+), plant